MTRILTLVGSAVIAAAAIVHGLSPVALAKGDQGARYHGV